MPRQTSPETSQMKHLSLHLRESCIFNKLDYYQTARNPSPFIRFVKLQNQLYKVCQGMYCAEITSFRRVQYKIPLNTK